MTIHEHSPELARDLFLSGQFDGKNLVDAEPGAGRTFAELEELYVRQRLDPSFHLGTFAARHLDMRGDCLGEGYIAERERLLPHANQLIKSNIFYQPISRGTLVGLPGEALQPCPGRFSDEQYAHDTGKVLPGLAADVSAFEAPGDAVMTGTERWSLIQSMVDNQVYLQRINAKYGNCIPTANREYYLSRTQITYAASNVKLLADKFEHDNPGVVSAEHPLIKYADFLLTEWKYWNGGRRNLDRSNHVGQTSEGVVLLDKQGMFGCYYRDGEDGPRLESWAEDMLALERARQRDPSIKADEFFGHWRAGATSGWDYSSERFFAIPDDPTSIQASHIVPVDLSSKQLELEQTLSQAYRLRANYHQQRRAPDAELADLERAKLFEERAQRRLAMVNNVHWDPDKGYYFDYNYRTGERTRAISTAGMYPLLVGAATEEQAAASVDMFEQELVRNGLVRVTNRKSSQQWDGLWWPGEHDAATLSLRRYGFAKLGFQLADTAIRTNEEVLRHMGSLQENLDPEAPIGTGSASDGKEGEYERQENFTWAGTSVRLAYGLRGEFAKMLEGAPHVPARERIVVEGASS